MSASFVAATSEHPPKITLKRKPPYIPETGVALRNHPDGVDVSLGIRHPVRRIRREDFDVQYALTLTEAYNLYYRLGRVLERQEREAARARRFGRHG